MEKHVLLPNVVIARLVVLRDKVFFFFWAIRATTCRPFVSCNRRLVWLGGHSFGPLGWNKLDMVCHSSASG
jgi:hypothetical protein